MTQPRTDFNPLLHDRQILATWRALLQAHLPLALQGTRITADQAWDVLCYASVQRTSIEAACQCLAQAPSGNRLREVLQPALPPRADLQRQLNTLLRRQLPRFLFKGRRAYTLALDITLIPYHGQAVRDDPHVLRAQAKCGTNHFHGYATVAIVHDRRRYVLALRFQRQHERMVETVRALLDRVKRLHLRVRRVLLDKEFFAVAVLRTLQRRRLAYLLPVPGRPQAKEMQRLCQGRRSHFGSYTVHSREDGDYQVQVALLKRQRRPGQRKVVRWLVFALADWPARRPAAQVFQAYRQRFGIESSYRQMNQVRARTSSRNPVLRWLLLGLALLLVNLYVSLRPVLRTRAGAARSVRRTWLTLRRLALLLAQVLEAQYGLAPLMHVRPLPVFS